MIDVINYIAVFLLIVFTVFLFHKGRKNRSNAILAFFFITEIIGYVVYFLFNRKNFSHPGIHYLGLSIGFLWAPLLYLYVKSLITKDFSFRINRSLHFLPFLIMLLSALFLFIHYNRYNNSTVGFLFWKSLMYVYVLGNLQVIVYNLLSLVTLNRYEKSMRDYSSATVARNLPWLKIILYGYITACAVNEGLFVTVDITNQLSDNWSNITYIAFFIFFNVLFYKALINPQLFVQPEEKVKYAASLLGHVEAQNYLNTIIHIMERKKSFLNPSLTIKELALETGISARIISQVLNQYQGQHFVDFVNAYRIEEAKRLIINTFPEKSTMLGVAFDAGFNSKTAFNVTFKKVTGFSPSEFRKRFCSA